MKKFVLLYAFAIWMVFPLFGQTQRLVLMEEATNASCGPCAGQNPGFDALLNSNRDKLTAIKYHWYFPGYDPMHNQNPTENDARVSYYGINGVPTAMVDGVIENGPSFGYPGSPAGYNQQIINDYYAIPSSFEIDMFHQITPGQDSIYVWMRIRAAEDVSSSSLKARMAVVEKHIHFNSAPGSNGEKDFLDVMKKMLPDQEGTAIPSHWQEGDYMILKESWKLQNIYNMDEVGVVGFIQRDMSKSVKQAGNSDTEPFAPYYTTDAALSSLSNLTETNCMGKMSPVITLSNFGSDNLTSVEIQYHVNNENIQSYNWNGNLAFLENTEIELPEIEFTVLDENELKIYLVSPNGTTDEYQKNDTITRVFDAAVLTPQEVKLMIKLDDHPEEITWDVVNEAGDIIFSGGPYTTQGAFVQETLNFEEPDCYQFNIYDAGGDGLQVPGFFALFFNGNNEILAGTNFGTIASAQFSVADPTGITFPEQKHEILIYPNPVAQNGFAAFTLFETADAEITIFDQLGRETGHFDYPQLNPGYHSIRFDVNGLEAGIYFLRVKIGDEATIRKISVL
jgi:hypothetical protein